MNPNPAAIGANTVEASCFGFTAIQISAVAQCKHIGINHIPQFVAQRRTQILHKENISGFAIAAPAGTFRNSQFYFWHTIISLK
jgi:hypothetical protein